MTSSPSAPTGAGTPSRSSTAAERDGQAVPIGTTAGRPGPGATLYEINPRAAYVAGLDVTPARIRVAVADITGRTVGEHRMPTPGRQAGGTVERVLVAPGQTVRAGQPLVSLISGDGAALRAEIDAASAAATAGAR